MIAGRTGRPQIVPVRTGVDLQAAIGLFRAYAASLDIDLAYQDFEGEMAAMPGRYAPPAGELLLARDAGGRAIGCVGLRSLPEQGVCEMKRLFVAPHGRGTGVGRRLVAAVVAAAQAVGHSEMRLDTLPSMTSAQGLYGAFGFEAMPAYYETPVAGTVFMRLQLSRAGRREPR